MRDVERYCVQPARAFYTCWEPRTWTQARAKAQAVQDKRADMRDFNDAGLLRRGMSLDLLTRVIDRWAREAGKPA